MATHSVHQVGQGFLVFVCRTGEWILPALLSKHAAYQGDGLAALQAIQGDMEALKRRWKGLTAGENEARAPQGLQCCASSKMCVRTSGSKAASGDTASVSSVGSGSTDSMLSRTSSTASWRRTRSIN